MSHDFRLEDHPIVMMRPSVVAPFGWVGHIPFAYLAVDLLRPRCIVELGVHSGNSYLALCQAVRKLELPARCFAVDTWEGDSHASHYGEQVYQSLRARHDPRYGDFSQLIRGRFDGALGRFSDGSIDLLHIDGLHTYEAVRHDFETWLPKLSDRAVVLLHDVAVHGFGVGKFFDEISARYSSFEFLHSHGLGVIAIGEKVPSAFVDFLRAAQERPNAMRAFFEALALNLVDERGHARHIINDPQPLTCHLYYRKRGESFEDARQISINVDAAENVLDVKFRLPFNISPAYLRIDPSDCPGVYGLQVWLRTDQDEAPVLFEDFPRRLGHVQGELLPSTASASGIRFASFDDDPYVEFEVGSDLEGRAVDGGLEVVIRIDYEAVITAPALRQMLERSALADMRTLAAARVDVQNTARMMLVRQDHLERQVQQLAEIVVSTQAEVVAKQAAIEQHVKHNIWSRLRRGGR